MKTEKTVEKLRADYEKAERELLQCNAILAMLPDSLERFDVMVHTTSYTADVRVGIHGKSYPGDVNPTVETVRELAALFPPEPCKLYTGTYKTFFAVGQFEKLSAAKPESFARDYKSEEKMCPWMMTLAPASFSNSAELEWFSVVDGVRLVIHIKFPLYSVREWLGTVDVRYKRVMGGQHVERNEFNPCQEHSFTLFEDDTPVAERRQSIRRWSTEENPGEHEIFWYPLDDRKPVTIEALCNAMEAPAKKLATGAE
jgi:hypothetical protein